MQGGGQFNESQKRHSRQQTLKNRFRNWIRNEDSSYPQWMSRLPHSRSAVIGVSGWLANVLLATSAHFIQAVDAAVHSWIIWDKLSSFAVCFALLCGKVSSKEKKCSAKCNEGFGTPAPLVEIFALWRSFIKWCIFRWKKIKSHLQSESTW